MDFDEKDAEVIKLLTQLKNSEGGYPMEMMVSRRQSYIQQLAGLGIGVGAAGALKEVIKGGGGSAIPPVAGTLLETILIVAIVAEGAAVALMNRDKLTDLLNTITNQPRVEEVVNTPIEAASPFTELVVPTTFEPTMTGTVTPVGTPSPVFLFVTRDAASDHEDSSHQAVSTPNPQDDNGNHYGLTPKPERTVGPSNGGSGGNDGGGGGGNNDGGNGGGSGGGNGGGNNQGGQNRP